MDDIANASLFVHNLDLNRLDLHAKPMLSHINVGSGKDVTIKELAQTVKEVVGFKGKIFLIIPGQMVQQENLWTLA
ncbi:hypothetical protein N9C22_04570 [Paracoccaceae bacterium]|nr:hypothetical protein [Paracoccaceae bacterium]